MKLIYFVIFTCSSFLFSFSSNKPPEKKFSLQVSNGSSSGTYKEGTRVAITADPALPGLQFANWQGHTQFLDSPSSSSTTLIMPAQDIALQATYKTIEVPDSQACQRLRPRHENHHHYSVLLFTETGAFFHPSIPKAIEKFVELADQQEFNLECSDNSDDLSAEFLNKFDTLVFLNTQGDIFNEAERQRIQNFIDQGGHFMGIHAAADTELNWDWYHRELIGNKFVSHTGIVEGKVLKSDFVHSSLSQTPSRWSRTDEWYNFDKNPKDNFHMLQRLDSRSVSGLSMGSDHPISWCRERGNSNIWYTAMGHTEGSYEDPTFMNMLGRALDWMNGELPGACNSSQSNFDKTVLARDLSQPMELEVATSGEVFFIERSGKLHVYDPQLQSKNEILNLDVSTENEYGLLGLALDPDFVNNRTLFLYYAPQNKKVFRLSSFEHKNNSIDKTQERIYLEIPVPREMCCHSGGALEFGNHGHLYISTGDDTNPFKSSGYAPINEVAGRHLEDAQRSSGNSNSLLGKILRIIPHLQGTQKYSLPAGNLFVAGTPFTRPEIFAMGARNPFRMKVDRLTDTLYWSDVGPDASNDSPARGPKGYDEINRSRTAGNYGWPYFVGNNFAYRDFNFANGQSFGFFDPNNVINDSPNNNGLTRLPNARSAFLYYPYQNSVEFPQLGFNNGRVSMAGPVIRVQENLSNPKGLPAYFSGRLVIYDWVNNWIKLVSFDDNNDLLNIEDSWQNLSLKHPIDMHFAHDNHLYVLEWGDDLSSGSNGTGRLSRIDFIGTTSQNPVARIRVDKESGLAPLSVQFNAQGSSDPLGQQLSYAWDFDNDGQIDSTQDSRTWTYNQNQVFNAKLTVTTTDGRQATASKNITVGNTRPLVRITSPKQGSFYNWGHELSYTIDVNDPDGSPVDPTQIKLTPALGHDEHTHPLKELTGPTGRFTTLLDDHSEGAKLFYSLNARYTDKNPNGTTGLTGSHAIFLNPTEFETEHFEQQQGIQVEATIDGGKSVAFINSGDWTRYKEINLEQVRKIHMRVASATAGGRIEMRLDRLDGPLAGTLKVPHTGGWQNWRNLEMPFSNITGSRVMFLLFLAPEGTSTEGFLFNVDKIMFEI